MPLQSSILLYIFLLFAPVLAFLQPSTFRVNQFNGKTLILNYEENDFALEYVGIHLENPKRIAYRYQMEGYHPEWVEAGTRRVAQFNDLKAGKYTFKVMAANSDGIWSEPMIMGIYILPPWWWTWKAKLIYFLSLVGILYGLYSQHMNRQIERAESNHLKELDSFKSRLYTNITHEFRTPLTVIQGMADQIHGHKKEKNLIQRNSMNLLGLVNQMMDLSRLDSGHLQFHPIQSDVISYVKYLIESYDSMAASRTIKLHFLPQVDQLWMDFDPDMLVKIIGNLLCNALKFTESDGDVYLIISTNNLLAKESSTNTFFDTLQVKKEYVFIQVKDNGIGISEQDQPHIFDRFYKVEQDPLINQEGTGIGLAYAYELVRLCKGRITVESELGKGSIFTVKLPITRNGPVQNLIHENHENKVYNEHNEKNQRIAGIIRNDLDAPVVLIIEDNQDVREYISQCLASDFQLVFALDGEQGVNVARDIIPDLIISDVLMPHKNGVELCKELNEDIRTSHIPIILLTAKVGVESRIAGYQAGADAYIGKPFNKSDLIAQMDQLISSRNKLQKRYEGGLSSLSLHAQDRLLKLEDSFVLELQQVILKNMEQETFGSTELCRELGMSSSQLYRKVKALTGKSIGVYIRSVRLARARELLLQTNQSVTEIAYEVGFKDSAYFSRCFSEEFGESPRGVRN